MHLPQSQLDQLLTVGDGQIWDKDPKSTLPGVLQTLLTAIARISTLSPDILF